MNIVVCVKRVPDLSEVEVEIDASGKHIRTADLTFGSPAVSTSASASRTASSGPSQNVMAWLFANR